MVKKAIVYLLLFSFSCCLCFIANAQENEESIVIPPDKPIIKLSNRFKPRPKFFEMNFVTFTDFKVNAESPLLEEENAVVSQNLIREIKLKFPILLKEKSNLIGGFGYRHEQFKFDQQSDPEYPLYERFDDRSLKRISFKLYYKNDLNGKNFLFIYLNSSLNSDKPDFQYLAQQLKLSISGVYGKNITPNKSMGWGVSFGYAFGQPAIFPIFSLNNDWTTNWGYELLLPKSAKLRYSINKSNHFYNTLELQGASYHLRDSLLTGFNELEFRRASIRYSFSYEREIHDWLWVGFKAGYRIPINLFLSEPRERRADALITIDARNAIYFNFTLFLVPPAKLLKKAKGR